LITNGTNAGIELNFNSIGIINGIINEAIQAEYYPEFATNNTYGIKSINDTVYSYMKFANFMFDGCLDQIAYCEQTNKTEPSEKAICSEAASMCRDNVEGPYYYYSGRGTYDIRHPSDDPTPPSYFTDYLNQASVQNSLGTNLNYTTTNNGEIYYSFQQSGDFIYNDFLSDLEELLNAGLRVSLIYGDADYICNWFGGEAVSKKVNYTHTAEFNAAGYTPFLVDGTEYGEVRQYGNFSFTRVYESGHEVPYYQPVASLELFRRTLNHLDIATGETMFTATYGTNGTANATHTAPFVPLPTATSSGTASLGAYQKSEHIVKPRWIKGKGKKVL
jgi:carboxypeptidase C (cathepsin A)